MNRTPPMQELRQLFLLRNWRRNIWFWIGCLLMMSGGALVYYLIQQQPPVILKIPDDDTIAGIPLPEEEYAKTQVRLLKGIRHNPSNWVNYSEMAEAQYSQGYYAEAASTAKKSLSLNGGSDVSTVGTLALALIHLNKPKDALKVLNNARRLDPFNGEIYAYRALVWKALGYPEKALEDYRLMAEWGGHLNLYQAAVENDGRRKHPILYWVTQPNHRLLAGSFALLVVMLLGIAIGWETKRRHALMSALKSLRPQPLPQTSRQKTAAGNSRLNDLWKRAVSKYKELCGLHMQSHRQWQENLNEAERLFHIAIPGFLEFIGGPEPALRILKRNSDDTADDAHSIYAGLQPKAGNWSIRFMVELEWKPDKYEHPGSLRLLYEFFVVFSGNIGQLRCAGARQDIKFGAKVSAEDLAPFYEEVFSITKTLLERLGPRPGVYNSEIKEWVLPVIGVKQSNPASDDPPSY